MDQIVVTLESLIEEVENALEYGKSLGYAECLSHTVQGKPASDDPNKAIKHYIKQLIEDYTED
jgi:hypothetical protein